MKISSARAEPFTSIRLRNLAEAGAKVGAPAGAVDQVAFMGVSEAELTPAVRQAIATLVIELEDLRTEVRRLKARLQDAETAADEDPLTTVKNRRAFVRELKRIAAFTQRYDAPASLVYFDLDDLKAINDRFGHGAGDAVLQAVGERLSRNVRESDIVGRMGGDEFAVLLAQADLPTAQAKAETLARLVEAEPVHVGDWLTPIKVSWGVSQIDPGLDPEKVIAEADAEMFGMKRARG
ncbi:MAG TPA: GGDEF domain-containing protein [Caulobacteraceae bacterium]|jgi:diguanylate cyclase (GGDEF)-like protein|nr:GGDEF domain-containing protein [Caulobacteraceae bacterium]